MATIVDIRVAATGRGARTSSAPVRGSAEILLFTGVQYSRMEGGNSARDTAAPRKLRDRLDLED